MVEGRSKAAFKTWLAERPQAWRDAIEVVAMDGFTGFKTATSEALPEAVTVMHPRPPSRRVAGSAPSSGQSSILGAAPARHRRSLWRASVAQAA